MVSTIGEHITTFQANGWKIFSLQGKVTTRTTAKYIAIFPSPNQELVIDLPLSNQIFVPEAMYSIASDTDSSTLETEDHPSIYPYFSISTVSFVPLSHLPLPITTIDDKVIFFYFYSLMKLWDNGLVPSSPLSLASLAQIRLWNEKTEYIWIDPFLQQSKVIHQDIIQLLKSIPSSGLTNYLLQLPISNPDMSNNNSDSRSIPVQYFQGCVDYVKQMWLDEDILSSTDKWVDVVDDEGAITFSLPSKIVETSSNQVLQDCVEMTGILNVTSPPQIRITQEAWKQIGIDLTEYPLTTRDYYYLQQLVDQIVYNQMTQENNDIPSLLLIQDSMRAQPYPDEYLHAWKVAATYF